MTTTFNQILLRQHLGLHAWFKTMWGSEQNHAQRNECHWILWNQRRPQTFQNWTYLRGLTESRVYPRPENDETQLLKERLCKKILSLISFGRTCVQCVRLGAPLSETVNWLVINDDNNDIWLLRKLLSLFIVCFWTGGCDNRTNGSVEAVRKHAANVRLQWIKSANCSRSIGILLPHRQIFLTINVHIISVMHVMKPTKIQNHLRLSYTAVCHFARCMPWPTEDSVLCILYWETMHPSCYRPIRLWDVI